MTAICSYVLKSHYLLRDGYWNDGCKDMSGICFIILQSRRKAVGRNETRLAIVGTCGVGGGRWWWWWYNSWYSLSHYENFHKNGPEIYIFSVLAHKNAIELCVFSNLMNSGNFLSLLGFLYRKSYCLQRADIYIVLTIYQTLL